MTPRVWSPTAVILARSCPLSWWLRYAEPDRPTRSGDDPEETPRMLGIVAHAGLAAAYRAARAGRSTDPTMTGLVRTALKAINAAWWDLALPVRSDSRIVVMSEVEAALRVLPRPHPAAVLAVEEPMPFAGPSGTPFTATPDLVLRTGYDSVHIRDWKRRAASGLGKPADLAEDDQMCPYAVAVAARWPWVRRVSVGLYSVVSTREVVLADLPVESALERVRGHEVTAHAMEHAAKFPPTPDGSNCMRCVGRARCPVGRPSIAGGVAR